MEVDHCEAIRDLCDEWQAYRARRRHIPTEFGAAFANADAMILAAFVHEYAAVDVEPPWLSPGQAAAPSGALRSLARLAHSTPALNRSLP
jgi:hypothetical protein